MRTGKVKFGYGIIQPRIGISLEESKKTIFTEIFAGSGGVDSYTNAISDTYQDNFGEGIYTGKGIYDLKTFNLIMKNKIPENTVLSHDLLEGCYLRCALCTDIMLLDGFPKSYLSYLARLSRWIRGDYQIYGFLKRKSNLSLISRYKILDNIRRSLLEITAILNIIIFTYLGLFLNIKLWVPILIMIFGVAFPSVLELFNCIIFRKENVKTQKRFEKNIDGLKASFFRALINIITLPTLAYTSLVSIVKTIYRMKISKEHLLEWTTFGDVEKQNSNSFLVVYKKMFPNAILSLILCLSLAFAKCMVPFKIFVYLLAFVFFIAPSVIWEISKENSHVKQIDKLNKDEKEYILDIAKKTWKFFAEFMNKENSYLPPDNFQENRREKIVYRTSSTNIGLGIMAIISGYDLKFITLEETIIKLENTLNTIRNLEKWNGHLYNWYDTKTLKPLRPRYISTVDSGNFIGYMYTLKAFLEEKKNTVYKDRIKELLDFVCEIIENTDFSYLYNEENGLLSIGFNVEDNQITDTYYDLLASEARQASLIAIAKKDIPAKHWNNLSRTLTKLGKYKGLISWSGTSFEYLMPNINIKKYPGSLLDESCKFMIMSQIKYASKLGIPWGISEAAFNLKDLNSNYQYKAFGIPWLGLKRGLGDEMVVASYGSVLGITDFPKEVLQNLKLLEKYGMQGEYGLFESIDYTPSRMDKGKKNAIVRTYMAHHQALILLSINNLINENILQNRFNENPEIKAVDILLQERMPKDMLITKERKEKLKRIKYTGFDNYVENRYTKINETLRKYNVLSNEGYVIEINDKGEGYSKYNDIIVNKYKETLDVPCRNILLCER